MADSALRRRLRDEQRSITYREAVRLGLRRPWTERQIEAARAIDEEFNSHRSVIFPFTRALPILTNGRMKWQAGLPWHKRNWPRLHRLRAWAERVLRETAELNGEGA